MKNTKKRALTSVPVSPPVPAVPEPAPAPAPEAAAAPETVPAPVAAKNGHGKPGKDVVIDARTAIPLDAGELMIISSINDQIADAEKRLGQARYQELVQRNTANQICIEIDNLKATLPKRAEEFLLKNGINLKRPNSGSWALDLDAEIPSLVRQA